MKRYNRKDSFKIMINYLKEHDDWVLLKSRDIAKTLNSGATYACTILQDIRNIPQIESREVRNNSVKHGYEYKYLTDIETSAPDTVYSSLTQYEVKMLNLLMTKNSIPPSSKNNLLGFISYLAKKGAKKDFVHDFSDYAKSQNVSNNTVEMYEGILSEIGAIIIKDSGAKISFKEYSLDECLDMMDSSEVATTFIQPSVSAIPTPQKVKINDVQSIIDSVNMFKDFLGNTVVKTLDKSAGNKQKIDELEKSVENLKKQCDNGQEAIRKYDEEVNKLRDELNRRNEELKKNKELLDNTVGLHEKKISHMNDQFQLLLAQATNCISDYGKIPVYKLNDVAKANFQNTLVKLISATIDDIIKYKVPADEAYNSKNKGERLF